MNERVKTDEFSQFFDSQLIVAHRCGDLDKYREFLFRMKNKIEETLSQTYELEQHPSTMQVAQTQHESRKRNRKVAMNTSVPFIQSQSMERSMPSKRVKERAMISYRI